MTEDDAMQRVEELEKLYDVAVADRVRMHTENEQLRAAMLEDMEGAKANCGKYGGARDCSSWTGRNLRCSDCPVEVWLSSTCEALAAQEIDE